MFCALLSGATFSQNSNAIFFSENGEKFYVIMNGLRENDEPKTNVKVTGLKPAGYKVKIIFENSALGSFDKSIYLDDYVEKTFMIKRKSEAGSTKAGKRFANKVTKNFQTGEDNKKDTAFTNREDWWTLKYVSQTDIVPPASTRAVAAQPQPAQPAQRVSADQFPPSNRSSTTTTTTTTTSATPAGGGSVSLNVNVSGDGGGGGGSVSINATDTYHSQTTTTTTSSGTVVEGDHYVMEGYSGPIGCAWPMSEGDFAAAKRSIASKDFEDSKMTVAKQVINTNCLFSSQIKEIMMLFDFEDTKLQLAKYAYGYTHDIGNYYLVNDAFEFESSIEDLNRYINNR